MQVRGERITLTGLNDEDQHIGHLAVLWEQLQLVSVEGAAHIEIDFLSFAQSTVYFAVISPNKDNDPDIPTNPAIIPSIPSPNWSYLSYLNEGIKPLGKSSSKVRGFTSCRS